jgi:NTE family protein
MQGHALVLGAGGQAAQAWETGLVFGMAERGVGLRDAGLMIGTSAGARVAVQLASEIPIEELYWRQVEVGAAERPPRMDFRAWADDVARIKQAGGGAAATLKRIGDWAMTAATESGDERRASLAAQLPADTWPEQRILLVAIEAETGERRVFDRTGGVALLDAVSASGALAGVWPPVHAECRHHIDGGFYSTDNADLAYGFERVVILALQPAGAPLGLVGLGPAVQALRDEGAQVEVIHPDTAAEAAIGGNLLDPAVRPAAARAGREQGRALADAWTGASARGDRERGLVEPRRQFSGRTGRTLAIEPHAGRV